MGKRELDKYECDICQTEVQVKRGKWPDGWAIFSTDHPIEERSWIDHAVCPACILLIEKARKR